MSGVNRTNEIQRRLIYKHLVNEGPISAVGLTMLYGIGSPRKRLSELKHDPAVIADGNDICSEFVRGTNRYGQETRYKMYFVQKREEDEDGAC